MLGDRLARAGAGEGADLHLGVLRRVVLLARHRAEPAEEEGERDRDDARVVEREPVEVDRRVRDHRRAEPGLGVGRLPGDDGRVYRYQGKTAPAGFKGGTDKPVTRFLYLTKPQQRWKCGEKWELVGIIVQP